jgi:hypothetical protein
MSISKERLAVILIPNLLARLRAAPTLTASQDNAEIGSPDEIKSTKKRPKRQFHATTSKLSIHQVTH